MLDIYYYISNFLKEERIAWKIINRIRDSFWVLEYMPKIHKLIDKSRYQNCRKK